MIMSGESLDIQNEDFKRFFDENIKNTIDFNETCLTRDDFGRPKTWYYNGAYKENNIQLIITAIYYSNSSKYDFKEFIINEIL